MALLSVLPVAALPAALRHQVLGLIADGSPGAVAQRLAVGQRAGRARARGIPPAAESAVRRSGCTTGPTPRFVRGGAAVGGAAIVGGVHRRQRTAAPSRTGRATGYRPRTAHYRCATRSGPISRRPRPAGSARGRGPPSPGPQGASRLRWRQRCRRRRCQYGSGRLAWHPGHLGGACRPRVSAVVAGTPDRVACEAQPQAVPEWPVDRDADPHRPRRAGLRLPPGRARAACSRTSPSAGSPGRWPPGRASSITVTAAGAALVLHRAADREPGRPQRPGDLSAARVASAMARRCR